MEMEVKDVLPIVVANHSRVWHTVCPSRHYPTGARRRMQTVAVVSLMARVYKAITPASVGQKPQASK
jgi:hypothetical protein